MQNVLRKDADWKAIEDYPCRVMEFNALAHVEDIKLSLPHPNDDTFAKVESADVSSRRSFPYASVILQCAKLGSTSEGFITHKIDFVHLWIVFKERGIKDDEEVVVFWVKKHLRWYARIFARFMPGLVVMICKRGAYELMKDPDCQPELRGLERWNAEKPIETWKPQVIE